MRNVKKSFFCAVIFFSIVLFAIGSVFSGLNFLNRAARPDPFAFQKFEKASVDMLNKYNPEKLFAAKTVSFEEFNNGGFEDCETVISDDGVLVSKPYQLKRIILTTDSKNFNKMGAIATSSLDDMWFLQYETEQQTKIAYEYYQTKDWVKTVMLDNVISVSGASSLSAQPTYANPWAANAIGAGNYNDYLVYKKTSTKPVYVAVLDTGITPTHSWFDGGIIDEAHGRNYVGRENPYNETIDPNTGEPVEGVNNYTLDWNGHGTHVAGIIANLTKNMNVKIIPVKVIDNDYGTSTSAILGMKYVIELTKPILADTAGQDLDIVAMNISFSGLGSSGERDTAETVFQDALAKGITPVVAAGNEGWNIAQPDNKYIWPAAAPSAITVTSVDENLSFYASGSNFSSDANQFVDVCAPGVGIVSAYSVQPNETKNGLMPYTGTSQAAPHVTAAIAAWATSGDYDKDNGKTDSSKIGARFGQNGDGVRRIGGKTGYSGQYGWGLISMDLNKGVPTFNITVTKASIDGGTGTVQWKNEAGQSLTSETIRSAPLRSTQTFVVTPDEDSIIESVYVSVTTIDNNNIRNENVFKGSGGDVFEYGIGGIFCNITVTVTFKSTLKISVTTSGGEGVVTPLGSGLLVQDINSIPPTFTITPNQGYFIKEVLVSPWVDYMNPNVTPPKNPDNGTWKAIDVWNGGSPRNGGTSLANGAFSYKFAFKNDIVKYSINIIFDAFTFDVKVETEGDGTVSPLTPQGTQAPVTVGDKTTYTVKAKYGSEYNFTVKGNGDASTPTRSLIETLVVDDVVILKPDFTRRLVQNNDVTWVAYDPFAAFNYSVLDIKDNNHKVYVKFRVADNDKTISAVSITVVGDAGNNKPGASPQSMLGDDVKFTSTPDLASTDPNYKLGFINGTTNYYTNLHSRVTKVTFAYTAVSAKSTIKFYKFGDIDNPISPVDVQVNIGVNRFFFTITAEDRSSETYHFTLTRADRTPLSIITITQPIKYNYAIGEPVDLSGGSVQVTYDNYEVILVPYEIFGQYNITVAALGELTMGQGNSKTIAITIGVEPNIKTCFFVINVSGAPPAMAITKIEVATSSTVKKTYNLGETVDLAGLIIKVTYNHTNYGTDGISYIAYADFAANGITVSNTATLTQTAGSFKPVKITYSGHEAVLYLNVNDPELTPPEEPEPPTEQWWEKLNDPALIVPVAGIAAAILLLSILVIAVKSKRKKSKE